MTPARETSDTASATRRTLDEYFRLLKNREDWTLLLADDVQLVNHAGPGRRIQGRNAVVEGTRGFYGMITAVLVEEIIVDGASACAFTHYRLQPPNGGPAFGSDVAERFRVRNGLIERFEIYFDTAPYPR